MPGPARRPTPPERRPLTAKNASAKNASEKRVSLIRAIFLRGLLVHCTVPYVETEVAVRRRQKRAAAPAQPRHPGPQLECVVHEKNRADQADGFSRRVFSQVVENGLTIPKEALRRENGQAGVYVLRGDRVEWQPIKLGASSITRTAVLSGLNEGDRVALSSETPLTSGERVEPAQGDGNHG